MSNTNTISKASNTIASVNKVATKTTASTSTSAMDKINNVKNKVYDNLSTGGLLGILLLVYLLVNFAYIMSENYRITSTLLELEKYSKRLAIDYRYLYQEGRLDKQFKNFYVATAHRPYLGKNQLFEYCSNSILLKTIKMGVRAVYLDIFNDSLSDDAYPVVSSGFEKGNWRLTLNSLSFDSVCQTIIKSAFTSGYVNNYDDPFILLLNLKTNNNFKCHNRIQESLFKYFKNRLLPSKFSYGRGDILNTPMRELMGKVVIMTSNGYQNSKLEEIVNFSWERDDFHKLSYKTLVDEVRDYNTIKLNMDDVRVQMRENLALIVPDDAVFFTNNYNPNNFFDTGCQMIAMNYQKVDKYMENYFSKFMYSSFVQKPKSLESLS